MNTVIAKLQRVTKREDRCASNGDPASIAQYHSAVAVYTVGFAEAVFKMQTLAACPAGMTLHIFYKLEDKPALQAAREKQIFSMQTT